MMDVWLKICRYAYRRMKHQGRPMPAGIPGNRDPRAPCGSYAPRPWQPGDFQNCESDGHYLCAECCHRKRCEDCSNPAEPASRWCEEHAEDEFQAGRRALDGESK